MNDTNMLKQLMDNIKDNIYFMDRNGRIILINQAGAKWLGFESPEEVIGKTDMDIFTDEHGCAAFEDEQRIMRTGEPILGIEEKETWVDGHVTWVSTTKMPWRDAHGNILGVFGISRDITKQKEAQLLADRFASENRQFRESMEVELCMAGELQKMFLPSSYPVFPKGSSETDSAVFFHHLDHPCGMVGGDFCSIRKLSDTKVGILVCDVMGHGVCAALCTALLRAIDEGISGKEIHPGSYLRHMNHALLPIIHQGKQFLYATACYMVLDVSCGTLYYANAGHPVPIIYNKQRAAWLVDAEATTGKALAISSDTNYETAEVTIHPGDSFLMFTDGIYEVLNHSGEEYGAERLLAAVHRCRHQPFPRMFSYLMEASIGFSAEGCLEDDVCLVGCKLERLINA